MLLCTSFNTGNEIVMFNYNFFFKVPNKVLMMCVVNKQKNKVEEFLLTKNFSLDTVNINRDRNLYFLFLFPNK